MPKIFCYSVASSCRTNCTVCDDAPCTKKFLSQLYISEDAAYLLVPCYHFAQLLGIEVPIITSCLHIDNAYNDTNYFTAGRTLEKMGLAGLSVEQIIEKVS